MIPTSVISTVVKALLDSRAKRTTKYLAPDLVVSVCARHRPDKRNRSNDYVLKLGKPNYLERRFIAQCRQAGEPFPVKKVQLKAWPIKRK